MLKKGNLIIIIINNHDNLYDNNNNNFNETYESCSVVWIKKLTRENCRGALRNDAATATTTTTAAADPQINFFCGKIKKNKIRIVWKYFFLFWKMRYETGNRKKKNICDRSSIRSLFEKKTLNVAKMAVPTSTTS